jgi:phosphatidylserine/phosphatidylglycerophosphate/cardiolipin synthase-like enzyme
VLALAQAVGHEEAGISATPTIVDVSLGSIARQRSYSLRVQPRAVDLDAIARLDALVLDVLTGRLDAADALRALADIRAHPLERPWYVLLAGIEDHFADGGFHDVMVRVTGNVVRQAQAAFLTSFRGHDGPLRDDLSPYFPEPAEAGSTPIALAQVIPGGFVAATQAVREQIDGARERLDLMNPYLTDRDMVDRIVAAGRRGVKVRLVSETSNNPPATAALEHHYGELIAAGAEIWEVPGTVVHAKVVVADDAVNFGMLNLDAWALYPDAEIAMVARSAEAATLFEERLFEPDIARSKRGEPRTATLERLEGRVWDKLSYFL